MKITIKLNDKPKFKKCEMKCDNKLSEKLDKYELTKFLNTHTTNLLIGKPKSGKTSLLYSLFKSGLLSKIWDKIFYFAPEQSRNSMSDNIFDSLPEEQKFNELTFENLDYVKNVIMSDPENNYCIIYDDMGAYLKNIETQKLFKELCMNKRHLHITQFFLVQTWYSVERDLRRIFDNLFVFRCSKDELTNLFSEVVEQKKNLIDEIIKIVYDKPFEYLFINPDSRRLFKGFDELIIE